VILVAGKAGHSAKAVETDIVVWQGRVQAAAVLQSCVGGTIIEITITAQRHRNYAHRPVEREATFPAPLR
jgi:hypothetical protein